MYTRYNIACKLSDGRWYHLILQCEASGAVGGRADWLVRPGGRLERRRDQTAAMSRRKGTHAYTHLTNFRFPDFTDFLSSARAQNRKSFIGPYDKTYRKLYVYLCPLIYILFFYLYIYLFLDINYSLTGPVIVCLLLLFICCLTVCHTY